jgi:hypothetical protein
MKQIKTRYMPARVVVALLYGDFHWLTRYADGHICIQLPAAARTFRISKCRLVDALYYLEMMELARALTVGPKSATLTLATPREGWV